MGLVGGWLDRWVGGMVVTGSGGSGASGGSGGSGWSGGSGDRVYFFSIFFPPKRVPYFFMVVRSMYVRWTLSWYYLVRK